MKKNILLIIITTCMVSSFISFAKEQTPSPFKTATGTIAITAPAELATVMRKMLLNICSKNSNLIGKVEEKDYASALTELQQGKSDIVLVNRQPTYLAKTYNEWITLPFAATAVVIITNSNNKISSLKATDLPRIFGGEAQRWKEFSGGTGGIHLIGLYATTSGGQIFSERVMDKAPISRQFFPVSTGAQVDIIIAVDKNAIGFRMYSAPATKNNKIKQVAINGIKAGIATISNGKYPFAVNYYLCYNKKSKNPLVAKFIKYFKTTDFISSLTDAGFIATGNKKKTTKK